MTNIFDTWLNLWRIGERVGETMRASSAVIDSRSRTMMAAARDPLQGDYAELSRMVPEKVEAFSLAGASLVNDWWAMQAQAMTLWSQWMTLATGHRAANFGDWMTMANRSSAMVERAGRSGGRALAPVHRAAIANARRLKRK